MHATQSAEPALTLESQEGIIERIVAEAASRIFDAQGKQGGLAVSKAWVSQRKEEIDRLGPDHAPWWCFWIEPSKKPRSKSCGPGKAGERLANQLRAKVEAQLTLGTYGQQPEATWDQFRAEYEQKVVSRLAPRTQTLVFRALDHWERIVAPTKMGAIRTATVDDFIAARRKDQSTRHPGELVTASTVNKDLRHLKAVLKKAFKWKYLPELPDFEFLREPKRLPAILEPDHFALLYRACDRMDKPASQAYPPADWWRALMVTLYMTGWRVGATLALKRADIDFSKGTALTRAEDTKGNRDQRVPIHPEVLRHWRLLPGFTAELFPWPHHERTLLVEFQWLCEQAGVPRYGFHALKKAYCSLNAKRIARQAMGVFAQHESSDTTDKWYIDAQRDLESEVLKVYVPDVLKETG